MKKSERGQEAVQPDEEEVDRAHWNTSSEDLARQLKEPILEEWVERWKLEPRIRWLRPAAYRIDDVFPRHPIDELASQAVRSHDPNSFNEPVENPTALRIALKRWQALGELVANGDDLEEVQGAVQLLDVLTTLISAALDRLEKPRVDPTPLWIFWNAAAEMVGRWQEGIATSTQSASLPTLLASVAPIVDRFDALNLGTELSDDVLVTSKEVGALIKQSARTMERQRLDWGAADVPGRGTSPALWSWRRIAPIVRLQYPHKQVPDEWPSHRIPIDGG